MIFLNLLSNAVKYTPEKGEVKLSIKKQSPYVCLQVQDNGYGIPKAQQSKMFSKLFRADNVKAMEIEGTGFGLYMIKAVVEQAGGKIWFESKENQGSTFFVQFPLKGMRAKKGTKALT
jgi:signal transduction histidine kinase